MSTYPVPSRRRDASILSLYRNGGEVKAVHVVARALRCHDRLIAPAAQSSPEPCFRQSPAVIRSYIEEVDPKIQSESDCADAFLLIDGAEFISKGRSSEADFREPQAGSAKLAVTHALCYLLSENERLLAALRPTIESARYEAGSEKLKGEPPSGYRK